MEPITDFYFFLFSVIFISLSGVMMPGPLFAVTVEKGYKNKAAGALITLGHGAIEFPLIFLLYLGLSNFFISASIQKVISLVGGAILIYMGVHAFITRKRKVYTEYEESKHTSSFIAGILATGANPYFFLWWATIGTMLIMNAYLFGFIGFLIFIVIHWSCDFLWNIFVTFTVFKLHRFWGEKMYNLIFLFCFVLLVGFGIWFIVSAFL
jgi:threonine/homoserine/homoserine lactone efflux protein